MVIASKVLIIGVIKNAIRVFHTVYSAHLMVHAKASFYHCIVLQKNKSRGKKADSAALSGVAVFRQLRLIFWQDAPLYYKKYPTLKIFSSNIFTKYKAAFKKWCQMVYDCLEEQEQIIQQAGGPPSCY